MLSAGLGRGASYDLAYEGLGMMEVGIAESMYERLIDNSALTERYLRRAHPKSFWDVCSVVLNCPDGRRAWLYGARKAWLEQKVATKPE